MLIRISSLTHPSPLLPQRPDVIFLQEVSAIEAGPRGSSYDLFKKSLADTGIYHLLADELLVERHPQYFSIMLVRARVTREIMPEYIRFRQTKMARHLISARARIMTEVTLGAFRTRIGARERFLTDLIIPFDHLSRSCSTFCPLYLFLLHKGGR